MELYHHGVLGQRWGVRRYQNKDGSLTALGKKRYAKDLSSQVVKEKDPYHAFEKYKDHALVTAIRNDPRVTGARKLLSNTPYDAPEDPYWDEDFLDKLNERAVKEFEKRYGIKYDPDNRDHEKELDYIESEVYDEVYESSGKAEAVRQSLWNKANDYYIKTEHEVAKEFLGSHANDIIKARSDQHLTVEDFVELILSTVKD